MRFSARTIVVTVLVCLLVAGGISLITFARDADEIHVKAYFDKVGGLYSGDEIRVLGIPVGRIDSIKPERTGVVVEFTVSRTQKIPANVNAVVLQPALVSARVIQLTPAYSGGEVLQDGAEIPKARTITPLEWDDIRAQSQALTDSLQPTTPGGVSPLGAAINTAADNLRGQGSDIHDAIVKFADAISALGDHSTDIFSTVKHLSILLTALRSSGDVLTQLNRNLAAVTGQLADTPEGVSRATRALSAAVDDIQGFLVDNRQSMGTSFDKIASITSALAASLPDIKQALHVAPNSLANFTNTYNPATGAITSNTVFPNFANPLQFICSSVQAASRLNYQQSAKLCAQYLAPIFKNRQYNFPPAGTTVSSFLQVPVPLPGPPLPLLLPFFPFLLPTPSVTVAPIPVAVVGPRARPNELTYSEDWMRPDYNYRPDPPAATPSPPPPPDSPAEGGTAPAGGLEGMMVPPGGTP
ncbi:MCE family protein [Mycobacteroides abscessus]|uniref:MCE family protein n=1 Tax=Mycobacteroides abscessus TaxID=36809 RepID=UPI000C266A90|nr:MCE family protein [Mycobacteroides abscessus]